MMRTIKGMNPVELKMANEALDMRQSGKKPCMKDHFCDRHEKSSDGGIRLSQVDIGRVNTGDR